PDNGLSSSSELLIFHLSSVSKERLIRKLGKITSDELKEALETVEDLIKL
ncbi:MAG TPA: transcription elongation factor GreAB, partial [Algoriphagus sp.]|nr:transcription elongation factor GreAB [Algoriphagus sp.]